MLPGHFESRDAVWTAFQFLGYSLTFSVRNARDIAESILFYEYLLQKACVQSDRLLENELLGKLFQHLSLCFAISPDELTDPNNVKIRISLISFGTHNFRTVLKTKPSVIDSRTAELAFSVVVGIFDSLMTIRLANLMDEEKIVMTHLSALLASAVSLSLRYGSEFSRFSGVCDKWSPNVFFVEMWCSLFAKFCRNSRMNKLKILAGLLDFQRFTNSEGLLYFEKCLSEVRDSFAALCATKNQFLVPKFPVTTVLEFLLEKALLVTEAGNILIPLLLKTLASLAILQ
jgi:hypothetical protein